MLGNDNHVSMFTPEYDREVSSAEAPIGNGAVLVAGADKIRFGENPEHEFLRDHPLSQLRFGMTSEPYHGLPYQKTGNFILARHCRKSNQNPSVCIAFRIRANHNGLAAKLRVIPLSQAAKNASISTWAMMRMERVYQDSKAAPLFGGAAFGMTTNAAGSSARARRSQARGPPRQGVQ